MPSPHFAAPEEPSYSQWHNPTDKPVRVPYADGTGKRYELRWQPGETKGVPSHLDDHIHRVECVNEDCRRGGYKFCLKAHGGTVVGGMAPQLVRMGVECVVPESMIPALAEQRAREAEVAAAAIQKHAAEQAMVIAAAKSIEAQKAVDAKIARK